LSEKRKSEIENERLANQVEAEVLNQRIKAEKLAIEVVKAKVSLINDIQKLKIPDANKDELIQAIAKQLGNLALAGSDLKSLPDSTDAEG